jgi:hypothetical protein
MKYTKMLPSPLLFYRKILHSFIHSHTTYIQSIIIIIIIIHHSFSSFIRDQANLQKKYQRCHHDHRCIFRSSILASSSQQLVLTNNFTTNILQGKRRHSYCNSNKQQWQYQHFVNYMMVMQDVYGIYYVVQYLVQSDYYGEVV